MQIKSLCSYWTTVRFIIPTACFRSRPRPCCLTALMTNTQINRDMTRTGVSFFLCFFFFPPKQNFPTSSDAHSFTQAAELPVFLRRTEGRTDWGTEPLRAELHAQSCRESHITTATGVHTESPSASVWSDPIHTHTHTHTHTADRTAPKNTVSLSPLFFYLLYVCV